MRELGLRPGRAFPFLVLVAVVAGCAAGTLREVKNAYNRGDFPGAAAVARRGDKEDPQIRLLAARAATRQVESSDTVDPAMLATIAADLRAAAVHYPLPEKWANHELAAGIAEWLMLADLPEVAAIYFEAGLEKVGKDVPPVEQALAEGAVQAGLESLDRWDHDDGARRLRELDRLVRKRLDGTGFPYPPGLADQALRVAWHSGDYREAWVLGAAGWLRATAEGDRHAAATLGIRLEEIVFPAWRESASDPTRIDMIEAAWRIAMRAWGGF